ncbi:hypothetical protein HA464_32375 (plasmid) [Rhizobium leguminosarum bv. trifolii]|uniref:hypothetical protein n=1 Tax=Rhizobium ruizarguesonis TaxID=2081791 RepID=UPI00103087E4|nr:hypothetical protein [Rhizobium ruizarguesonis]QIO48699.1 hypothetical protein HA464_32375 [Rhizobium leguminosarum bv. trifolii]TAW39022.1 hypothetical protein ELI17_37495 [Rhizobium ruizarguesonis]TAY06409.1 hypothetical protein ELH92_37335 [Rhizobium ruizarguesonis]
MVMYLPSPQTDSEQLVDDIVVERQNGPNAAYFTGISPAWRARVADYIAQGGSPAAVPTWPQIEPRKTSFLTLYLSPADGSVQGEILKVMRKHGLSVCPACGEPGAPNTLDHYLPKTRYPHFCVTPHNLFPMCDACQKEKDTKTGDAQTPRFFLHPYYDTFLVHQILDLTIQAPFETPTFTLNVSQALEPDQITLVTAHVRELALAERYGHFFRNQYRRLIRLVTRMRENHQDVRATLATFTFAAADPSPNSWDHIFYTSVMSNPPLLAYLEAGGLPTLP